MDINFGQKISELRKQVELSQKELAAKLGISAQYLNDIEHGRRHPPSEEIIQQMAKIFKVNADVLLIAAGTAPKYIQESALNQPEALREALAVFRRSQKK